MYYKLEQMGESIHAKMNKLNRRFQSIKEPEERLWKIVEEYEKMNGIDKNNLKPTKGKNKVPLIARIGLIPAITLSIVGLLLAPVGL